MAAASQPTTNARLTSLREANGATGNQEEFSETAATEMRRSPRFFQLVERPEPDIAHRDLAWLAFDFEADQSRLVID